MTNICVVPMTRGFAVDQDGVRLAFRDSMDEALKITALLVRCNAGDQTACAELDALGLEPPVLELDDSPLPASIDPGYLDPADVGAYDEAMADRADELSDLARDEGSSRYVPARRVNEEWVPGFVRYSPVR